MKNSFSRVSALLALVAFYSMAIAEALPKHPRVGDNRPTTTVPSSIAAKKATPSVNGNSIKIFLFTAETFEAVQVELAKRGFVISKLPAAPAIGSTARAEGISREGLQAHFTIDRVVGHFHAYIEYRRPQHPFAACYMYRRTSCLAPLIKAYRQ